jgi:1-acyl-sn-glycerol-3-phosphate acyltransferase
MTERDPKTISKYRRMLEMYVSWYRPDVRGFENLPDVGPFLVVGNHSGGATPPDMPILMTAWWRRRGVEEPVYGLFHSMFLNLPGLKEPLTKFGALEAGWNSAEKVLTEDGIVVVYPGGDYEAFRPFKERNRISFAGRAGFIKLALRTGVPIVPAVTHGVQDSILVLTRGERLLGLMPYMKRLRLKVAPLLVGLPWGVSMGLPTIPLPAKATVQLCPPIDLGYGADAADDDEVISKCYELVTETMQRVLDDLAAERGPWPLSMIR